MPTNKETARALFAAWKLGVAPAALDAVPALLGSVQASDLAAVLRACQASAVVSVIGASAP